MPSSIYLATTPQSYPSTRPTFNHSYCVLALANELSGLTCHESAQRHFSLHFNFFFLTNTSPSHLTCRAIGTNSSPEIKKTTHQTQCLRLHLESVVPRTPRSAPRRVCDLFNQTETKICWLTQTRPQRSQAWSLCLHVLRQRAA